MRWYHELNGTGRGATLSIFTFDANDPVALQTFSDEVFIGRIVAKLRTDYLDEDGDDPMTVFEVKLVRMLDGSADTDTRVGFEGGISKDGKELVLPEGDDLPAIGRAYLLAGRRMPNGVLDLVPIYGAVAVPTAADQQAAARRFS